MLYADLLTPVALPLPPLFPKMESNWDRIRLHGLNLVSFGNCILAQMLLYYNRDPLLSDSYVVILLLFCVAFGVSAFYYCLYQIYFPVPNNRRPFPCWLVSLFFVAAVSMHILTFVYSIRIALLFDLLSSEKSLLALFLISFSGVALLTTLSFICWAPVPIVCGSHSVAPALVLARAAGPAAIERTSFSSQSSSSSVSSVAVEVSPVPAVASMASVAPPFSDLTLAEVVPQ
jgi:hypothetical protein